jgi:dTDP-glucose 4,6-dehydratase
MNYFITGGAGFIGSNFVRMLLTNQLGSVAKVTVIDKLTYAGNLENLSEISSDQRFKFIKGDICNEELVRSSVSQNDIVVHFAAESHVDRSISGPSEFIKTNVLGTQVLLSAAVENQARLFLHVSTDEVYGSIASGSSVETDSLLPNSPYSASKAASDLLVRSYVQTYGLDARITRCCNNFGPNQYPEKFIPLAIERLQNGNNIPIYGDGQNVREWIHVEDHCRGIYEVISGGTRGEIYNIGSGVQYSNLQVAELILTELNLDATRIDFVQDRLGHDFRYSINGEKMKEMFGFVANRSLKEEIAKLVTSPINKNE